MSDNNTKTNDMTTLMELTNKTYTATNGRVFKVYSKNTKNGLRFYKMTTDGRMLPVSKNDIN